MSTIEAEPFAYAVHSQPEPTGDGVDITPLVCRDLELRSEHGVRKYGRPLRAFDGRDGLVDLYDELLDAAVYARKCLHEQRVSPASSAAVTLIREALGAYQASEGLDRGWAQRAIAFMQTVPERAPEPPTSAEEALRHATAECEALNALRASQSRRLANAERITREVRAELERAHAALQAIRTDALGALLDEVQVWQAQTFPGATIKGAVRHLEKECREVIDLAERAEAERAERGANMRAEVLAELRVEVADLFFLVAQVAACTGMGSSALTATVRAKLGENRRRRWMPPDADGVVEHVREEPSP